MISVKNLTKSYGGRVLFENVNVVFQEGVNTGLTGPNGSGKSTFMKLLMKVEECDYGKVHLPRKTAWLRQDQFEFDDYRVLEVVLMGNRRLWNAMLEKEMLYAKSEITDEDGARLGELEGIVAEEDGYVAEPEAESLLEGLGIPPSMHHKELKKLEPGLKLRVLLAQALFGKPHALLLDEPTNHLDIDAIRWLEHFLQNYRGVLVVISHDRRFLNAICDQIADIDYESIILYPGNYDQMVRQKIQVQDAKLSESDDKKKKISQLQEFVNRFRAGSRASQVRSRARQIEKLRPDEIKRSNIVRPFIQFDFEERSGKDALRVEDLSASYGSHKIFRDFRSYVTRGEKVVVVGRNGIGKTTLLRTLFEELSPQKGIVYWGHNTNVGYMPQNHDELIPPGKNIFEWLHEHKPSADKERIRGILGRMLFRGDDVKKVTDYLSGGERVRLIFCRLALMGHNVLLLDEPTNHLDLESISALADGIKRYRGTIIFVTHDRDLASRASRVWGFPKQGKLVDFQGNIDAYLAKYTK